MNEKERILKLLKAKPMTATEINLALGKKIKERFGPVIVFQRPAKLHEMEKEGLIEFDEAIQKWRVKGENDGEFRF